MSVLFKRPANLISILTLLLSTQAIAEPAPLPVLDATFETVQCAKPCKKPAKRSWWLMRQSEQIELRDFEPKSGELAKRGEIWKHSPNGKIGYLFLMHPDKRAIEYLFDDLKVLGIKSDENQWQITSQLVSDSELAGLKKISQKPATYHGYETESYTGTINDAKVKLVWLPQLRLPAKLDYIYPKSTVTIQLHQLNVQGSTSGKPAPQTTESILNTYQQVYFTDIGDMEQNDDAKEWLAKAQGAPGLHAHHH